jgi:hypothetical protein
MSLEAYMASKGEARFFCEVRNDLSKRERATKPRGVRAWGDGIFIVFELNTEWTIANRWRAAKPRGIRSSVLRFLLRYRKGQGAAVV